MGEIHNLDPIDINADVTEFYIRKSTIGEQERSLPLGSLLLASMASCTIRENGKHRCSQSSITVQNLHRFVDDQLHPQGQHSVFPIGTPVVKVESR